MSETNSADRQAIPFRVAYFDIPQNGQVFQMALILYNDLWRISHIFEGATKWYLKGSFTGGKFRVLKHTTNSGAFRTNLLQVAYNALLQQGLIAPIPQEELIKL